MMASLHDIQRELQAHLLDPRTVVDHLIVETRHISRATRLHIYVNAYRARFVEALTADYRVLRKYIGDDEFEQLIHAYIAKHPSRYFSFRHVGGELENFLQTTAPYNEHLDLIELARFEWALCHAFDAANAKPIPHDYLAQLNAQQWPTLRLGFTASLRCIDLQENTVELWKALNEDRAPEQALPQPAQTWLIWRKELKLLFRPALPHEVITLDAFAGGASFGEVCELLTDYLPDEAVPQCVVGLLQQWLQDELIVT